MRQETENSMQVARVAAAQLPIMARGFASAIMAVLECMNKELAEVKRGN